MDANYASTVCGYRRVVPTWNYRVAAYKLENLIETESQTPNLNLNWKTNNRS